MNGEQKKDELSELRFESNLLKFTSEFKRFIISIVDEHIERRTIEEKAKAKEEKADIVFYTVEEVCKILKISRASLYIYTHKKDG